MVTLKDVAEKAGVSTQLVSVVINGKAEHYRIPQATSDRISQMAHQMGYDPDNHRGARQMAARKHGVRIAYNVIAVCSVSDVIPGSPPSQISFRVQPYESEILAGVDAAAYKYGLDILTCRHYGDKLPRLIENGEVDGVIPLGSSISIMNQIAELGIPAVKLIGTYEKFHNVVIDNYGGMYDVVKQLFNLGHRNIAYVGQLIGEEMENKIAFVPSRERFAGYQQAMQDCGLSLQYVDTSLDQHSVEMGAAAMDAIWEKSQGEITAVACYNDMLAMGAIRSLEERGVKVPLDVSVTGFDDVSRQFAFNPLISSVYYDRFKLGYRAVEILWELRDSWLAGKTVEPTHEVLSTEFIARQSTAKPRFEKERN